MEPELCLHEKPARNASSQCEDSILGIEYKPLDWSRATDLVPLFWEYWLIVNGEDLSTMRDIDLGDVVVTMLDAESKIYQLRSEGMQFQMACDGDKYVGFLMYRLAYNVIMAIDGAFVMPEYEDKNIAKNLVDTVSDKLVEVIFQTKIDIEPERLLKIIRGKDFSEISRDETKITWRMKWESIKTT